MNIVHKRQSKIVDNRVFKSNLATRKTKIKARVMLSIKKLLKNKKEN